MHFCNNTNKQQVNCETTNNQQAGQDTTPASGQQMLVDELSNRLENNVSIDSIYRQVGSGYNYSSNCQQQHGSCNIDDKFQIAGQGSAFESNVGNPLMMSVDNDDNDIDEMMGSDNNRETSEITTAASRGDRRQQTSGMLIVTNLDPSLFSEKTLKSKFESLFTAYDANVTFRYLKSFRRVRLDFSTAQLAEQAKLNLNNYKLGNSVFKCYMAQMIKPNFVHNDGSSDDQDSPENEYSNNAYLRLPKLTKQFLISPPASPPVDWEPVTESSPCIDVQLVSAIANLVPGEVHEIHQGNESQPGIFVEVCEEARFDGLKSVAQQRGCPRIPKTPSPS